MASPQTLSLADRRVVAAWAADCAERVLGLFEAEAPEDDRARDAIARTRAFAHGELDVADQIRRRFKGSGTARDVRSPAAVAAARAAGQAAAIPHMGAHALGAAAYAAKAAGLAVPDRPEAVSEEIRWQLGRMSWRSEPSCESCRPSVRMRPVPSGRGFSPQAFSERSSVISRRTLRSASHSNPSRSSFPHPDSRWTRRRLSR